MFTLHDVRELVRETNPYTQNPVVWERLNTKVTSHQFNAYKTRWIELARAVREAMKLQLAHTVQNHEIFLVSESRPADATFSIRDNLPLDDPAFRAFNSFREFLAGYGLADPPGSR